MNRYFSNGQNATDAYLTVHPACKYRTAQTQAWRLLQKPHIKAEIAHRVRYDGGITKDLLESDLLYYRELARSKQDYVAGASIAMDCAKLAGFLVEKRQDVTPPPELSPSELVAELRKRSAPCPN